MTTFVAEGCIRLMVGTPHMYRLKIYDGDADKAFSDDTSQPIAGYCFLENELNEYRLWPIWHGLTQAILEEIFSTNLLYGFEVRDVHLNQIDMDVYNSQFDGIKERVRTS